MKLNDPARAWCFRVHVNELCTVRLRCGIKKKGGYGGTKWREGWRQMRDKKGLVIHVMNI